MAKGKLAARLREEAKSLFMQGIAAADPASCVRRALEGRSVASDPGGKLVIIAIGKAAIPMMTEALVAVGPNKPDAAIVVTNHENVAELNDCRVLGCGHPLPDEHGLAAGRIVMDILSGLGAGDFALILISGGGSALLPCPPEGLTLADKIRVTEQLLACGADITEINTVRKGLSLSKGGGLARLAAPAKVLSLLLSDVPGDDLAMIASGPTVFSAVTGRDLQAVFEKYGIADQLPDAVQAIISNCKDTEYTDDQMAFGHVENILVGSNRMSVDAVMEAASERWDVVLLRSWLDGDVSDAVAVLVNAARSHANPPRPVALICGGETTVIVKGDGMGGRNQELALRFVLSACDEIPDGSWVLLSGGTDGRDGPTDAAGAIVDPGTAGRLRDAGIDARALLANNDAYHALEAAGDLLITGATGTNVADIQILLIDGPGG